MDTLGLEAHPIRAMNVFRAKFVLRAKVVLRATNLFQGLNVFGVMDDFRLPSLRPILAREDGGTMVEAAVSMAMLMMIIFGIMDCSRALYIDHYVRYTAEEAVRYAMVRGSTWNNAVCTTPATFSCTATSANVKAEVASAMPAGVDSTGSLSVVTTWTGNTPTGAACNSTNIANSPGCVVQVKVSYNFNFILPFLPNNAMVLSSTASAVITQ